MLIIAECGCNWESLEQAKKMIKRSKEVGCFASKFQLFTKKEAPKLPEHLYLTFKQAKELFDYGKSINQKVFFTVMYPEAVDICEKIGVNYYKIRYKDNCNWELLNKIVSTKKITFISIETWFLRNIPLPDNWNSLFCVPKYPADIKDYNRVLNGHAIYKVDGISDHTPNLKMLKFFLNKFSDKYFEKHMKLENSKPLENDWSVSFKELEKVFK